LLERQIEYINLTPKLEIAFLTGELSLVDKKERDFYVGTKGMSTSDILMKLQKEGERYALLADVNNDGNIDIMYKSGDAIKLKEGKKDKTFDKASTITNESYKSLIKETIGDSFFGR
jgi:hypothetical protein